MRNNFYVQNELSQVYNKLVVLSEELKIATYLVSKNANSTLYNKALLNKGYKTLFSINLHMMGWWSLLDKVLLKNDDNYRKVVVIRDPLSRIESAYNTIGNRLPLLFYIEKVIYSLLNFRLCDIDRHIMDLFIQYNISKVDTFIPILYLDSYLHSIALDLLKVNVGKTHIKIENLLLLELLLPLINLYNFILNSNKCFKPNE